MDIRPIRTAEDHRAALARIDKLMGAEAGTSDADEMEILAVLVERYERAAFAITSLAGLDAIQFRTGQTGYGRSGLELPAIRIRPVSTTDDTVTLSRADWGRLVEALEDAEDSASVAAWRAYEAAVGKEAARANCLPGDLVHRMIEGEHPLRIWREHRGLTIETLSHRSGVPHGEIAKIEGRQEAGSVETLQRLARALAIDVDSILPALPDEGSNGT